MQVPQVWADVSHVGPSQKHRNWNVMRIETFLSQDGWEENTVKDLITGSFMASFHFKPLGRRCSRAQLLTWRAAAAAGPASTCHQQAHWPVLHCGWLLHPLCSRSGRCSKGGKTVRRWCLTHRQDRHIYSGLHHTAGLTLHLCLIPHLHPAPRCLFASALTEEV